MIQTEIVIQTELLLQRQVLLCVERERERERDKRKEDGKSRFRKWKLKPKSNFGEEIKFEAKVGAHFRFRNQCHKHFFKVA